MTKSRVDEYGELPSTQGDWENQQKRSGRNAVCVRYVVGLCSMIICLATWQTMNEVINTLQEQFPKPYMVTWVLHNGYLVFMLFFLPILWLLQCARGTQCARFSFKDFLWAALFNLLLFASDYMWVLALANANVLPALTSAIFNTCGVFVYILSVLFLGEVVDLRKIISLVIAVAGVVVILVSAIEDVPSNGTDAGFNYTTECTANYTVPLGDPDLCFEPYANNTDTDVQTSGVIGYSVMTGCAVLFAVYEVVFSKWEQGHEELLVKRNPHRSHGDSCARVLDTLQTVALMGLANISLMWIPMLILHYTGFEHFALPLFRFAGTDACCWSGASYEMLLNAGLGAMYTSSFLVAVAMIGPFIASVGLILIIPIGFVTDYFLGNWDPATKTALVLALEISGCVLIAVGFGLLQWASRVEGKKRCRRGNARRYCECILC